MSRMHFFDHEDNANNQPAEKEQKSWTRRQVLKASAAGLAVSAAAGSLLSEMALRAGSASGAPVAMLPWPDANAIVAATTLPTIPNKVFNVSA